MTPNILLNMVNWYNRVWKSTLSEYLILLFKFVWTLREHPFIVIILLLLLLALSSCVIFIIIIIAVV
jgi:hypothetical protein